MSDTRIYLDHNATAPLVPAARAAIAAALEVWGNPSSVHAEGRAARDLVEAARREIAALVAGEPDEIVFTSGGTEADCLGAVGLARAARAGGAPARVLVAEIDHPALLGAAGTLAAEGFEVVAIPVGADGLIDPAGLARALSGGAALVAIALANHELGALQDVPAAAAAAREAGAFVHVDAVQAAGRVTLDAGALGADAVALSAHKIGGPKGVGALWIRRGIDLAPLAPAGHQERERRPGTENVPGIAGFGAAAEHARAGLARAGEVRALAAELAGGVAASDGGRVHGPDVAGPRSVGNTVCASFDGALGETVVMALDLAGVAASTGAACTSGTVQPSAALLALGHPRERAAEAVRFSLGPANTRDEVQETLELLSPIIARARQFR